MAACAAQAVGVGCSQVEYNVNDGFEPHYCKALPCKLEYGGLNTQLRRSYERLLRKLLMLPHRPAVIMLQTFDYSGRWDPCHPRPSLDLNLHGRSGLLSAFQGTPSPSR